MCLSIRWSTLVSSPGLTVPLPAPNRRGYRMDDVGLRELGMV
jgi:hypothetical protein